MKTGIQIKVSGPFFSKAPAEVLTRHLRSAISDVTDEGVKEARAIASGFRKTGRYQGAIRGRVGKRLRGKVQVGARAKAYRAVIEGGRYWPISGTRFKGYHTMRRSRQAIEPRVVPIVERRMTALVREIG